MHRLKVVQHASKQAQLVLVESSELPDGVPGNPDREMVIDNIRAFHLSPAPYAGASTKIMIEVDSAFPVEVEVRR